MTPHPLWKPLAKNAPANCVRYQVLALLREVGYLTAERLTELRPDITRVQAAHHLYMLHRIGHCWSKRITRKVVTYFATPELMEADEPAPKPKPKPMQNVATKLDPQAPAKIPEGVTVQVCKPWTHDPRTQVDPAIKRLPPDMQGAGFVAEWNRLRRSTSTPKKESASC